MDPQSNRPYLATTVALVSCILALPACESRQGDGPGATPSSGESVGAASSGSDGVKTATMKVTPGPKFASAALELREVKGVLGGEFVCWGQTFPEFDKAILIEADERCDERHGALHLVDTTTGKVLATFGRVASFSQKAGYLHVWGLGAGEELLDPEERKRSMRNPAFVSLKTGEAFPIDRLQHVQYLLVPELDKIIAMRSDRQTREWSWGLLDGPPLDEEEIELSWPAVGVPQGPAVAYEQRPGVLFFRARECDRLAMPLAGGEMKCEARFPHSMFNGISSYWTYDLLFRWDAEKGIFDSHNLANGEKRDLTPEGCHSPVGVSMRNQTVPHVVFTCLAAPRDYVRRTSTRVWTPAGVFELPGGPYHDKPSNDGLKPLYKLGGPLGGNDYRWFDVRALTLYDGVDEVHRLGAFGADNEETLKRRTDKVLYRVDAENLEVLRLAEFECPGPIGLSADSREVLGYFCGPPRHSQPTKEECRDGAAGAAVQQPIVFDVEHGKQYQPKVPVVGHTKGALLLQDSRFFVNLVKPCESRKVWIAKR